MKKSTSASVLLLALICAINLNDVVSEGPKEVESWFETLRREKPAEKMTKLHFYFHDISKGKNVTSAEVVQSNVTSPISFGSLYAADDPMTAGPDLVSKRVGYLKGLYMTTSFEELDLVVAMAFVFTDEIYNGSTLAVLGNNPQLDYYREVPVIGGSGQFSLARGVATLHTVLYNGSAGIALVEVDIVVFHY